MKLAVGLALGGIVVAWLQRPHRAGDTGPLFTGTEALGRCVSERQLVSCEVAPSIDPYPLLQHVPDLFADSVLELSEGGRVRILASLSVVGVMLAVGAGWLALRRIGCAEWRWGFVLVGVCGPALAYGNTTWGEMLAMGLVTLFVAVALVPARPWLVGWAAFGAGLTKETSYPFVIALGLVALLLARRRSSNSVRPQVLAAALGVLVAVVLAAAFNVLRFGTPRNAYYLDPELRTTTAHWVAELAAGLFVSPNGGILVFWPLASLLVGALVSGPLIRGVHGRATWSDAWPALALVSIVVAITVGLATWWAPFGWWAWGPRLSLPWVLPIVLLSLATYAPSLIAARALAHPAVLVLASSVATVVALPHVGLLWHPETVGEFFFTPHSGVCPGGGPPPTPDYYACLHEELWKRRPIWLNALAGLRTTGGIATSIAVAIVATGSLTLLRRDTAPSLAAPRSVGSTPAPLR